VVLLREALAISGGNELTCALGISSWLIGVAVSAFFAGKLSRPKQALELGLMLVPVFMGAAFLALKLHGIVLYVPTGGDPSIMGISLILLVGLGLGGFATGFVFTATARTLDDGLEAPVSELYFSEALGALIGGLGFVYLLSGNISNLGAVVIVTGLLVGVFVARKNVTRSIRTGGWLLVIVLAASTITGLVEYINIKT
jgi:hypothetical protein